MSSHQGALQSVPATSSQPTIPPTCNQRPCELVAKKSTTNYIPHIKCLQCEKDFTDDETFYNHADIRHPVHAIGYYQTRQKNDKRYVLIKTSEVREKKYVNIAQGNVHCPLPKSRCKASYRTTNFIRHLRLAHTNTTSKCPRCNKGLSKSSLRYHKKRCRVKAENSKEPHPAQTLEVTAAEQDNALTNIHSSNRSLSSSPSSMRDSPEPQTSQKAVLPTDQYSTLSYHAGSQVATPDAESQKALGLNILYLDCTKDDFEFSQLIAGDTLDYETWNIDPNLYFCHQPEIQHNSYPARPGVIAEELEESLALGAGNLGWCNSDDIGVPVTPVTGYSNLL
ncbi:hypothetical protein QQS21_002103 [Conoideocrella luteorostrata]|uniref:C2H2-type domain-containing protein n=1 Tax=Conoideocrella luteorostrata TaxID=1105319 RepID=A0AAJ0CVP3_9HYPO|nr:hypothetical protein QQS21_002103 [Conoideocrella luteorostrata]